MIKTASYSIQMAYDITDIEKKDAKNSVIYFNFFIQEMKIAEDYLDQGYTSFKDFGKTTDSDDAYKNRVFLRNYRDEVKEKFKKIKTDALKAQRSLSQFILDGEIKKLDESFVTAVEELDKQIDNFIEIFNSLQSKDFFQILVASCEAIKKECAQLKDLVDERIVPHINKNILSFNWIDDEKKKNNLQDEHKVPHIIELSEKNNKQSKNK